jgi:hypothetical protein
MHDIRSVTSDFNASILSNTSEPGSHSEAASPHSSRKALTAFDDSVLLFLPFFFFFGGCSRMVSSMRSLKYYIKYITVYC